MSVIRFFSPGGLRMSSGMRMLLVLTGALLPLGIGAVIASFGSAASKKVQHQEEAQLVATAAAQRIDLLMIRGADIIRFAAGAVGENRVRCRAMVGETGKLLRFDIQIALFAPDGTLRCATAGFDASGLRPARGQIRVDAALDSNRGLVFTANALDGSYGVGRVSTDLLRSAVGIGGRRQGIQLRQGDRSITLAVSPAVRTFDEQLNAEAPVARGQLTLIATNIINSVTSFEILLLLLPVLMWAAAALIGWIVVNQLLIRPLRDLEQAVSAFGAGGHAASFALPKLNSPATEIEALGKAFADAAEQITLREAALEQGLQHQVRLTREVHHRVKNNLQVVASLINLHARGAEGAVADAYASIQRRVDALAVVHRNHYAELEENRGVALRALLAELTANLRATAPQGAASTAITLDMPPRHISQDTAVPVAFLVTEFVELLMIAAPGSAVVICLSDDQEARGTLLVRSTAFIGEGCSSHPAFSRFERIVTGLSRQLRSALTFDAAAGSYAISIALIPEPAPVSGKN